MNKKDKTKTITIKKDEGVKGGGGHIKLGAVMTLTYKVTNWHK